MYIENLSNEEITKRIKDFCYRTIVTVNNEKRTARDLYNIILEVNDWIKAFFKIYKENQNPELMKVIDHLELMKACSENIGDDERIDAGRRAIKLKEMEVLSIKLIEMIESPSQNSKAYADEPESSATAKYKSSEKQSRAEKQASDAIQGILDAEGIDTIKISKIE